MYFTFLQGFSEPPVQELAFGELDSPNEQN